MATSKIVLKRADYELIEKDPKVGLKDSEDYAVTTVKNHGVWVRSIHIFSRRPSAQELHKYEETASRVRLKGNKAELEGKKLVAARDLYNVLIDRVIDAQIGRKNYPLLTRDEAASNIEPLMKRAAILDMVSEVYSATQLEDREGEDASSSVDKEDD